MLVVQATNTGVGRPGYEAMYMYVNCKHMVSVYSLVTLVVSLLIFVAAAQESYGYLPIVL